VVYRRESRPPAYLISTKTPVLAENTHPFEASRSAWVTCAGRKVHPFGNHRGGMRDCLRV